MKMLRDDNDEVEFVFAAGTPAPSFARRQGGTETTATSKPAASAGSSEGTYVPASARPSSSSRTSPTYDRPARSALTRASSASSPTTGNPSSTARIATGSPT